MTLMGVVTSDLALQPGFGGTVSKGVIAIALYALIGVVLMVVAFHVIDLTTPGPLARLVRTGHPNAVAISASGLFSMALIVVVAILQSGGQLADGLLTALIFGLVGIVVQAVAVRILTAIARIDLAALLDAQRFTPLAIAVASAQLSVGLVVAVAIS